MSQDPAPTPKQNPTPLFDGAQKKSYVYIDTEKYQLPTPTKPQPLPERPKPQPYAQTNPTNQTWHPTKKPKKTLAQKISKTFKILPNIILPLVWLSILATIFLVVKTFL